MTFNAPVGWAAALWLDEEGDLLVVVAVAFVDAPVVVEDPAAIRALLDAVTETTVAVPVRVWVEDGEVVATAASIFSCLSVFALTA